MQNEIWLWSAAFTGTVEGLIQGPSADVRTRWDWPERRDRLVGWLREVEAARDLYRHGNAQPLRSLYDHWRNLAGDDIREQARIASETHQRFGFSSGD